MNDAASGYDRAYNAWRADPEAWWAAAAEGISWERRWDRVFDPSLGPYGRWFAGGHAQHLLQLPRPPRDRRARRAGRADLGQPDDRAGRDLQLPPAAGAHREAGRRAGGAGGRARRPRGDLHADGARGGDRHAGLRAPGRHPFRGVRWLRRRRARHPHRRCQAEGHRLGVLRPRTGPRGEIQAAAGRGDRALAAQAGRLPDPAARGRPRRAGAGTRPRPAGSRGRRGTA